uniref:Uncharacterized protein n=1 Tax=Schizaphis graminum TaxID=13262 RepID=A0A2S2NVA0_SCHGA
MNKKKIKKKTKREKNIKHQNKNNLTNLYCIHCMYAIVVCMYTPLEFTGARSLTLTHIYMYINIINQTIKLNNEKKTTKNKQFIARNVTQLKKKNIRVCETRNATNVSVGNDR